MATALHREAVVQPDGTITLTVPELQPGQRVSVTIDAAGTAPMRTRRATDVINEVPGHLEFQTAEEVDAYLKEERDSWDR
jgi:hypothetical protein